jgi:hypothetical protein
LILDAVSSISRQCRSMFSPVFTLVQRLIVRLGLSPGRNGECTVSALFWADFTLSLLGLSLPLASHDHGGTSRLQEYQDSCAWARQRFAGGSNAMHCIVVWPQLQFLQLT